MQWWCAFPDLSPDIHVQDKKAVAHLLAAVDKANGYVYASLANDQSPYPPEFIYGSAVQVNAPPALHASKHPCLHSMPCTPEAVPVKYKV